MNSNDREYFLVRAIEAGLPYNYAKRVRSLAVTHDRLATAACNGDWPCDNGERKVIFCSRCEGGMVASKIVKGVCESCRVEDRIKAICAEWNVTVDFQGDPRGWTVKLARAEGR